MARKVLFHEVGGPDVLRIESVPAPVPGPGEVRLRVKAIGLNRAEIMYRSGAYVQDPVYPAQLGYEAAGEIDAVGPGVAGFAAGDRVSVIPAFGFSEYGLYGDLVLAPARATVKHPASLSWEEAAATWMQYVTVWGALIDIAKLGPGDVVLLPAASSSVGLAAIQVARRVGATPIALTRTSAKAAALKEAGAAHVIATETQDVVAEVMRLTDGKGARVVFDPVGGPMFGKLAEAAEEGGILFIYGALSPEPLSMPVLAVLAKHLTIRGYELFEVTGDDVKIEAAKAFVLDGLLADAFKPKIAKTFPFEQIADAHRYMETNAQVGKVVVTV
jgi:NADPH:quinone reductase-like Zn-dependent oxidoreductase